MDSRRVAEFLRAVDRAWLALEGEPRVRLDIVGGSALLLRTNYARVTEDVDVLEAWLDPSLGERVNEIAGISSPLRDRHGLYVQRIAPGLPFLPRVPRWHVVELGLGLRHLDIRALDLVDVAISKLKRFDSRDESDIDWLVANEYVSLQDFRARFHLAYDDAAESSKEDLLERVVRHFNRVERDYFAASETPVEPPDWTR